MQGVVSVLCFSAVPTPTISSFFAYNNTTRRERLQLHHHIRAKTAASKLFTVSAHLQLKHPPYPLDALEPYMSKNALEHHWGGHQRFHVDALSQMISGTDMEGMALEDIMMKTSGREGIHAAQIWNHDFFWQSMKPNGGGQPSGRLMEMIQRDFGSFDKMIEEIIKAATSHFGSGWVWLAYKANKLNVDNAVNPRPSEKDNKLVIHKSPNAVNPLAWDYSPLLAIDVWEHAYYLDYENRKAEFASVFMEKLISWEVVSSRLDLAISRAANRQQENEGRNDNIESVTNNGAVEMYLDSDNEIDELETE